MSRTTIDLDESMVEEAASVLGTQGKTDTVRAALTDVIQRRRRAQAVETFHALTLDLDNPNVMEGAWR